MFWLVVVLALWMAVLLAVPALLVRRGRGARMPRAPRYGEWKEQNFDARGRCKMHPDYDGSDWPVNDDCDACAVVHATRPDAAGRS
jgi:hypothetical protein